MENGGMKENWYAFFIAIVNKKTTSQALESMNVFTEKTNLIESNRRSAIKKMKIPLTDTEKIKYMRAEGMSGKQIGKLYGCSDIAVYNFIKHYVNV